MKNIQKTRNFWLTFTSVTVKGVDEMKKLSIFLVLIMIIALFPSCSGGYEFELTYESDRSVYISGETVKITAKVTNISGKIYTYKGCSSDYRPYVWLYPVLDDGSLGEPLEHFPIASTTDMPSKHKVKNGESGSVTFEFPISKDAHMGKYTVKLGYEDISKVFDGALVVVRLAEQNENEKYRYSPITVASGEAGIHPIKCALGSTHYVNGEARETGCSDGVWYLFNNPETDPNGFPTLVLNGKIDLYVPTHITYNERPALYDMNYEWIEYGGNFEGLSNLPAGEYLVVFSEYESGEVDSPQDYWKSHWENVFKLIVRS